VGRGDNGVEKLHYEELNDLYSSPNIVRVRTSRRMRWAGHVAGMGGGETYRGFWWENLRVRDHLGDIGVDGGIILNGSSGSRMWGYGVDRADSGWKQVAGTCECGNEPSGSTK